jgi:plastocyanin domain-containing protein
MGMLIYFGLVWGDGGAIVSQVARLATQTFQRVDQPLIVKLVVTAIGVSLIGLELWWFLRHRSKSSA